MDLLRVDARVVPGDAKDLRAEFLRRYPVQQVGGSTMLELWVPAEELDAFNTNIVGRIEVVHEFR